MSCNKRLLREIHRMTIEQNKKEHLLDNDYLVSIDEENTNKVYAIIQCPFESVYRHTFIRLNFEIPEDYPISPPIVTFVNYDGVRIHPNMYEDGKCCATILNTWPSVNEKWTASMGIETIILAFLSFLDNDPYTHEPGGFDEPTYSVYVRHQSFQTCLLKYLEHEKVEIFQRYMSLYMFSYIDEIFNELMYLTNQFPKGVYMTRCFEIEYYTINYEEIRDTLSYYVHTLEIPEEEVELGDEMSEVNDNFVCEICFDTVNEDDKRVPVSTYRIECQHVFHSVCLLKHVRKNSAVCPMCRKDLKWVINPETKRRVKTGSRKYKELVELM